MTRLFLSAALALTVLFLAPRSGAGEGTGASWAISGDLTLEKAVEAALRQNPDIRKQLQEIQRTRGQIVEVRAQALPHVGVSGNFRQVDRRLVAGGSFDSSDLSPTTTTTTTSTGGVTTTSTAIPVAGGDQGGGSGPGDKSWSVTITARQVLYSGGQVRAAINIAKFTEDSSYYQLRDTVDRIIALTRVQFYEVLLTRALITVQEEAVRLLGDGLKDQQNRFEAGTVPRFNVLRAEVDLSNAQPDLIRAKSNALIAQLQLAKTLALNPGPKGQPTFHCVGEFSVIEPRLGLTEAIAAAKEKRAFLKVQRQQILTGKEQIKVALAGYKPRLDANAGYELHNSRFTDNLDKIVDGWFFGVTGSWDIFDGLETAGKVQQARAQLEFAKINYDDSVQKVELEVQQSYANLQAARETIRSQQKNVEAALEALRLANERLLAGAGTQLDVLDARVALTKARTSEIQSRATYNQELSEFDRVTATETLYSETFEDPLTKRQAPKTAPAAPPAPTKKKAP